ncbi:hypothetical protein [Paenibacillus taiwanensis]|uniref:hypothetical protein n=1 Tax=Paenibacillus taiwanensis TaxID=401638 RepID=UPI0003F84575|nr:hypothetical protein [Paenibacillus taiwanensis]
MTYVRSDRYNRYFYLAPADDTYEFQSLLMDTNTAINLEKFYYNPQKMNDIDIKATTEFLLNNIKSDPVYGFAVQEACWDYTLGRLNEGQYQKMTSALENQYNWDISKIQQHALSQGQLFKNDVFRSKVKELETLTDQIEECNPFLVGSYACILKILIVQMKHKSPLKSIYEYLDYVNNEIMTNYALETQLAINYFLGNDKMYALGNSIFKFDRKKENVLLKACNASWDMFFLRLLQMSHFHSGVSKALNTFKPNLVTTDHGIKNFAQLCSVEAVINKDNKFVPILSFIEENIKNEYLKHVENIESELYFKVLEREAARDILNGDSNSYLLESITKLEKELKLIS